MPHHRSLLDRCFGAKRSRRHWQGGSVEIGQWKGRRRTLEKSATCTWSENWAVAKYGIKAPKSDPRLRRRGIVTYLVVATSVTISPILPSLLPGHDGYRAGLVRAPERAHAVDGLKRDRSVGRSRLTSTRGLSPLTEPLPAPQMTAVLAGQPVSQQPMSPPLPWRLHKQFIHWCELNRPRRRHVVEAAAERIVVADRRPVDPHRRVDRSLPDPARRCRSRS